MSNSVVTIQNLVKRYDDLLAVDHFSLNIKEGEILGLLGPNGSGKTTVINCLLSLLQYDKGEISVWGKPMTSSSYDIKKGIGIVPQEVAVFKDLTVQENIDYFCGLYINDRHRRKSLVQEAIQFVELEEFKKFYPRKLSGGLRRRLNIACGIVHKPKLIIMDEPTIAVDPQSRNRILEGIRKLNEEGATIIYTSHYMEEIEQLCSRIIIMDRGRNLAEGTKEELKLMIRTGETVRFEILSLDPGHLKHIRELKHIFDVHYEENQLTVRCRRGSHNLITLLEYMNQNDIVCGRIFSELPTLNDVFLEITGKELRD